MATVSNSFLSGAPLKSINQSITFGPSHAGKVLFPANKKVLKIEAGYSSSRPSSGSIFVGGFLLGGMVVGALGCIYAPQIASALAGTDKKEIMKKLPKFIYDEEKDMEKKRKILEEKIASLNAAIDEASSNFTN